MGLRGALRGFGLKVGRTTPRTFELLDFARQFLRRAPELGPPITRQLKLQLGDLGPRRQRVARHLGDNALQRGNVVGQGFRRDRHTRDWIRSATAWLSVSDEPWPRSERLDGRVLFAAADQCAVTSPKA